MNPRAMAPGVRVSSVPILCNVAQCLECGTRKPRRIKEQYPSVRPVTFAISCNDNRFNLGKTFILKYLSSCESLCSRSHRAASRWRFSIRSPRLRAALPPRAGSRPSLSRARTARAMVIRRVSPSPLSLRPCQGQPGTRPRTMRNIMGNDLGPSGNPARYPARTWR